MRQFGDFVQGPNFETARTRSVSQFAQILIDGSVASATDGVVYNIAGDFLYLDFSSPGDVTVELNSDAPGIVPSITLKPGTSISALFSSVRVRWAQAFGNPLKLLYSTGDKIEPQSATVAVSGVVQNSIVAFSPASSGTVPLVGGADNAFFDTTRYHLGVREFGVPGNAAVFANQVANTAVTAQTAIAAASNTLGLIVFEANSFVNQGAGTGTCSILAKATAPTILSDGEPIGMLQQYVASAGNFSSVFGTVRPHRVSAGKGVHFISQSNDVVALKFLKYQIL